MSTPLLTAARSRPSPLARSTPHSRQRPLCLDWRACPWDIMPTGRTPSPLDLHPRARLLQSALCREVKVTEARGQAEATAQGPEGSALLPAYPSPKTPHRQDWGTHTEPWGVAPGLCPPPAAAGLAFRALPTSSLPGTRNTRGSSSAEAGFFKSLNLFLEETASWFIFKCESRFHPQLPTAWLPCQTLPISSRPSGKTDIKYPHPRHFS